MSAAKLKTLVFGIKTAFIHKLFTKIFAKTVDKGVIVFYIINRVSTRTYRVLTLKTR